MGMSQPGFNCNGRKQKLAWLEFAAVLPLGRVAGTFRRPQR